MFWNATFLDLNEIFIIVATVPTGLQTCAKMLQMHLSGGGGTPWLQPKSNETFKLASTQFLKFLTAGFGFKHFHYSGHCAHRVANLCKNGCKCTFQGVGGHLGCNPKVMKLLNWSSTQLLNVLEC